MSVLLSLASHLKNAIMPSTKVGDLSEEFVLSHTKQKNIAYVKALDVSDQDLFSLDVILMNRMSRLEILNLADNELDVIPPDLELRMLRKLDVSNNSLKDISFVERLTSLQEINTEGNYFKTDDRYIAVVLCPSIAKINGKDVDTFKRFAQTKASRYEKEIKRLWDVEHSDKFHHDMNPRVVKQLCTDLHKAASDLNLDTNLPAPQFRQFMIERICKQIIEDVVNNKYIPLAKTPKLSVKPIMQNKGKRTFTVLKEKHINSPQKTPQKLRNSLSSPQKNQRQTPTKRTPTKRTPTKGTPKKGTPFNLGSPMKGSPMKSSPRKALLKSHQQNTPSKRATTTPSKSTPTKRPRSPVKSPASSRGTEPPVKRQRVHTSIENISQLPPLADYNPTHFLRCHFCDRDAVRKGHTTNDPTDSLTKIWWCAFEPDKDRPGETTSTVATCGGSTVCLLDCGTGKVIKRFQQHREQFYALAWTTIDMEKDGRKWKTNILAVGGWNGHIRLLHPEQLVCYKELGNSGRPNKSTVEFYTSCLTFHPKQPTLLFSGASDASVTLYDIGKPQAQNYDNVQARVLRVFDAPSDLLNLFITSKHDLLVGGCEDGCYVWDISNVSTDEKFVKKRQAYCQELVLPREIDYAVDGLAMLNDDYVVSRSREDSCIYVWQLSNFVTQKKEKVTVKPLLRLNWTQTEETAINMSAGLGVLGVGDHMGNLYLYNLSPLLNNVQLRSSDKLQPSQVLPWPDLFIDDRKVKDAQMNDVADMKGTIMNCVAVSSSHEYVVGGTSSNVLCIWKSTSA